MYCKGTVQFYYIIGFFAFYVLHNFPNYRADLFWSASHCFLAWLRPCALNVIGRPLTEA
ncbi:hypothetical protein ASPFODRAFT_465964 [Aspergillus luchuensis CBS 106.47]|uniref:Uncharacterized protein n=1 Tax=Aspergillus luchuensis (strain CBS 106.47) TaxID=1137211 RepID=A0A1M3T012_ASPLC|nr:hypothetical protein ASPFODRAFT_465964 [Aspergillus luchuensis CBS 106.47]